LVHDGELSGLADPSVEVLHHDDGEQEASLGIFE
jgi:hypothetical protein